MPTAVTLALGEGAAAADRKTVDEKAGQVTLTATLDAPTPYSASLSLYPGPDDTATRDADYILPDSITIPAGERSGAGVITIVDDALDEDGETVNVAAVAALFHADLIGSATLTITNDDTAGVTVNAANPLSVAEGGTATYTVVLDSRPTANVTVAASSGNMDKATVSPESHTFTPSAWNTLLTFTVSGVADADTNDESVGISHLITSADGKYAVVSATSVSVAVSDTTQAQQDPPNQPPTVSAAIGDATIVHQRDQASFPLRSIQRRRQRPTDHHRRS